MSLPPMTPASPEGGGDVRRQPVPELHRSPHDAFLAVKLDIVKSRKLADRARVQEILQQAVDEANASFQRAIRSRFVITHGDEVQGLLSPAYAAVAVDVMEHFADRLRPVQLRYGIGFGSLSTRLLPTAIGMDGAAWHLAKAAIEWAARERMFVHCAGFVEPTNTAISALANLLVHLRAKWSPEQQIVIARLEHGSDPKMPVAYQAYGTTQEASTAEQKSAPPQARIARDLGISEAAVSKRLAAAGWRFYRDGRHALCQLLVWAVQSPPST